MIAGANEIAYLAELRKRRAELDYKKGYLLRKGRNSSDPLVSALEHELAGLSSQLELLEKKIAERKIALFYPNEDEIARITKEISAFKPEEIDKAMESKEGNAYALLQARAKFTKENYERRLENADLIAFANSLPSKIREEIIERARKGKVGELDASTVDENTRLQLLKLLNRCGLECSLDRHKLVSGKGKGTLWNEIRLELDGASIWADPKLESEVAQLSKNMGETSKSIQLMNAERHIRTFGPEENAAFAELQKKYLEMIRRKEQLAGR